MDGADARAGEHRDGRFRHERHVDGHAITAAYAELLQDIRELLDFDVEIPVRQRATVAGLTLPDDGGFVPPRRVDMAIDAIVRNIDLAADEPFCPRWMPVEHLAPSLDPV